MKFDHYEYIVSEHYLPAIVNDDYSSLDDGEIEKLVTWLDGVPINGHWDIEDNSEGIRTCEICELLSNCMTIKRYFPIGD